MNKKNKNIIIIVIVIAVLAVVGIIANQISQKPSNPEETPTPTVSADPTTSEAPTSEAPTGEPTTLPETATVEWETKIADNGMATFEIPADWERNEANSTVGYDLYVPIDLDAENRTSNVIVQMSETGKSTPSYEETKEAFYSTIDEQFKSILPDAEITGKRDYEATYGHVFEVTLKFELDGKEINQIESYYFVDNYRCTITASDFGEGISPTVFEVSEHIIDTMILDEYGEGVELEIDGETGEVTEIEPSTEPLDPNTMTEEEIVAELAKDKGTWEGNTYTNSNIDFSITIPEGWEYLTWDEIYKAMGDWTLDAYEVFAYSEDASEILQIYLEKHIGDTTLDEYMDIAEQQMLNSTDKTYTIDDKYSKKIAGKEYQIIESTSVDAEGRTLKEYNYVAAVNDNFLCITATCPPEEAEGMVKMLEESIH